VSARRLAALALMACTSTPPREGAAPPPPPTASVEAPALLFPGGRVALRGTGFLTGTAGETRVFFAGRLGARPLQFEWPALETAPDRLVLALTPEVLAALGAPALPDAALTGTLRVDVVPRDQPALATRAEFPLAVEVRTQPAPALLAVETDALAPGGHVRVRAHDLLGPGEGQSTLLLTGAFSADDVSVAPRPVVDARLPLVEAVGRGEGAFALGAGVFGLAPGTFEGTARLSLTTTDGRVYESAALPTVTLVQLPVALPPPPPLTLARGEILRLPAPGALPLDAGAQTATVLVLEGTFTPRDGGPPETLAGPTAWRWAPEDVPGPDTLRLSLRTRAADEAATLASGERPGRFEGQVRMVVRAGRAQSETAPVPLTLTLAPMRQAVVLDFTPGFEEGLALFGLADASREIRERVLAVCRRDYAGLRVTFSESPPADTVEFTTIELGGRDPNGLGLLGLENTAVKDTDNRRLDERLGGRNAVSAESGAPAFGGIFVSSFLRLSPGQPEPAAIASPAFDAIFAPFSPEIAPDAEPWRGLAEEIGTEDAEARITAQKDAVRVLGNLIGSTVTHELGHALGLSAVPGRVHNPGDWPGDLMDRGDARPLAERAELDGTPPGRFTNVNAEYLQRLLGEP
jgi:hypothetical protein